MMTPEEEFKVMCMEQCIVALAHELEAAAEVIRYNSATGAYASNGSNLAALFTARARAALRDFASPDAPSHIEVVKP